MSELFDKEVNAQKERNLQGSRKLPQAHVKSAMKMKVEEKNEGRLKHF